MSGEKAHSKAGDICLSNYGHFEYVDYYGERRDVRMYVKGTKLCMFSEDSDFLHYSITGKPFGQTTIPVKEG